MLDLLFPLELLELPLPEAEPPEPDVPLTDAPDEEFEVDVLAVPADLAVEPLLP